MPRGKKNPVVAPTKVKKTKKGAAPAVEAPLENLVIPEMELLRLTRAEAEMRASAADLTVQRSLKEGVLQKLDPKGILRALDAKIQMSGVAYQDAKSEYEQLRDRIGKALGIDMTKYSFDDRTGVLHDLGITSPAE